MKFQNELLESYNLSKFTPPENENYEDSYSFALDEFLPVNLRLNRRKTRHGAALCLVRGRYNVRPALFDLELKHSVTVFKIRVNCDLLAGRYPANAVLARA